MSEHERTRIDEPNALPAGTRFGELEILRTLGVGGFGIVYLARDHALDRDVAIKEYMPSQFAQRDGQSHVSVRSQSMVETFEIGRRSFVNEARLLARFDHPSLLKVHRFWEANGTAYMAMPFLQGRNLREARKDQPMPPSEAWLRSVIDPVLGGLTCLHAQNVWHRDVAPDNIFLPADGSPAILLDFGAARQAIGDRTQAFTAILKPNYAPIEQYAEAQTLRQGPWTDIYALAAVIHTLLTGKPPPPATTRALHDDYRPPEGLGVSPGLLAGLEWGLRVAPQDRPQSVAEWREALDGRRVPPPRTTAPRAAPPPNDDFEATVVVPKTQAPLPPVPRVAAPQPAAVSAPMPLPPVAAPQAPASAPAKAPPPAKAAKPTPPAAPATPSKSRLPLLLAGAAGVAVMGGAAWMFNRPAADEAAALQPPAASAPALSPAPSPAPSAAPLPALAPASAPAPAPAPTPASAPPATPPTLAPAPAPTTTAPAPAPLPTTAPATASKDPARRPEPAASAAPKPQPPKATAPSTFKPNEVGRPPAASPMPPPASWGEATPPARHTAPAPKPEAAPAEPTPTGPRTASEACGKRVFLARALCIDEQCQRPEFKADPECVKLREIRERNRGGVP